MINYVNNSFDKVLKPCDAQKFMELTQSELTEKLILGHRAGEKNSKAKLPALTYMGALDLPRYQEYLNECERQGARAALGSRRAEFMRPTGLLMLDFDHVGDPVKLWEAIVQRHTDAGTDMARAIALAHITPSGDGLRVVLKRTQDTTIEHDQWAWCELMKLDAKPDPACKDISRLSFAPMQKEILYYNPSLLFAELPEASDYPNNDFFGQSLAVASGEVAAPTLQSEAREEYDTEYNGVPYSEIVARLEDQLGGKPERGARNSFIFTMACNLRYICDDNAVWVASILPTYGEDAQKHRQTIQSAINRPMSREMPATLARALKVSDAVAHREGAAAQEAAPPALPEVLPQPVSLLVSRTPDKMKPAVAMAIFPPLGAHVKDFRVHYWDGRDYEPTFMNIVVAELSSGKSAVNKPIEYIMSDIELRDEAAINQLKSWREKCANIPDPKNHPERPKGLYVQSLSSDMTNAAFVQRLAESEGHFLYTQMDEIELLDALKTNGRGGMVSAVLRLAFDCGKYGQERVAANAVNAKVRVRWNWNASSTIQRVRKYFARNIADGTLSRISFATIIKEARDYGRSRPRYLPYGERFADELRPYIDRLNVTTGTLHCPEAEVWAERLCDELSDFAEEVEDETYATMSFRAVLMGFFRAMLLYVMNDMQWTREIAEFAAWSVKYDLWCKMRFFRDMLHNDLAGEQTAKQRGPVGLLSMLPKEFTREDVKALRIAQGMSPNPRCVLAQWVSKGQIVKDEKRGNYVKNDYGL